MRIDKSAWGAGPWQDEPDRAEWRHDGLPCLALRNERSGNWCGYVGVPPEHPLHGKSYSELNVDVHGGLTYANACSGHICHVPEPGEPDHVWWFGFDCHHARDLAPGVPLKFRFDFGDSVYRTLEYVTNETNCLASQLKDLGNGGSDDPPNH